ncbi:MAG: glycosyltransferase family 2 protein [candidate division WOR-3 bacterium]
MKLSVLIPAYNEAESIAQIVKRVMAVPVEKEIVVVDDCSTDRTFDIIRSLPGLTVCRHKVNQGKGAAIRTALDHATGDIAVVQDADLEYDPADYPKLLAPFTDPNVHVVFGSRFLGRGSFLFTSWLANIFLTLLTNALFGGGITDMETCYKAIRLPLFRRLKLQARRFDIEPEITAKLLRLGVRIIEVPISYHARRKGKKIGLKDAFVACYTLLKIYVS